MPTLETVEVHNWKDGGEGMLRINKSDFDPKIHHLYSEHLPEAKPKRVRKTKTKAGAE